MMRLSWARSLYWLIRFLLRKTAFLDSSWTAQGAKQDTLINNTTTTPGPTVGRKQQDWPMFHGSAVSLCREIARDSGGATSSPTAPMQWTLITV